MKSGEKTNYKPYAGQLSHWRRVNFNQEQKPVQRIVIMTSPSSTFQTFELYAADGSLILKVGSDDPDADHKREIILKDNERIIGFRGKACNVPVGLNALAIDPQFVIGRLE